MTMAGISISITCFFIKIHQNEPFQPLLLVIRISLCKARCVHTLFDWISYCERHFQLSNVLFDKTNENIWAFQFNRTYSRFIVSDISKLTITMWNLFLILSLSQYECSMTNKSIIPNSDLTFGEQFMKPSWILDAVLWYFDNPFRSSNFIELNIQFRANECYQRISHSFGNLCDFWMWCRSVMEC